MGMTYTELLEKELKLTKQNSLLKEANEKLKEQIDTSQTSRLIAENNRLNEICRYWENEHDKLLDENDKIKEKNENQKQTFLHWKNKYYELRIENKKLKKERNTYAPNEVFKIKKENERLEKENRNLFHRDTELHDNINDKLKIINNLIEQNTKLKFINNKKDKTIERLITIITDEHYN